MKKYSLVLTVSFLSLLFIAGSCDKNEPQAPTKSEYIRTGTWKFQSATYGGLDVSNAPQLACFVDNTIRFTSANYTVDEGTIICVPSTAGTNTWSLQNNDTQLVLANSLVPGGSGTFTLVSVNANNLVISQMATIPPATSAQEVVVTFKH
jgi:hypothetical protein